MIQFIYNNGLGDIKFSSEPSDFGSNAMDYLLKDYSGLSETEIILPVSKGYQQNGYTLQGVNLGKRIINITFYVWSKNSYSIDNYRKSICALVNPMRGEGQLSYYNSETNKTYVIKCICSEMPKVTKKLDCNLAEVSIEFTANNPLWRSQNPQSEKTYIMGDIVSYGNFIARNDGDIPAPFTFTITAPVYKGYIRLMDTSSGDKILNNFSFTASQLQSNTSKLTLTTDYGNKNLWLTVSGTDKLANRYITNPDFFTIPIGTNTFNPIRWGLEGSSAAPAGSYAEVSWYDWYLGV